MFVWFNWREFHCVVLCASLQFVLTRDLWEQLVQTKAVVWCLGRGAVDLTKMTDRKQLQEQCVRCRR